MEKPFTLTEVEEAIEICCRHVNWQGPEPNKRHFHQNRIGHRPFWEEVTGKFTLDLSTVTAHVEHWNCQSGKKTSLRGGRNVRPVPGKGLDGRAPIGLCSSIAMIKAKYLTNSSQRMVSYAACVPRQFF